MTESSSSHDDEDIAEEENQDVEVIYDQLYYQDEPLAVVEDDKGNREADVEGFTPAALEARYRKRMVRVIAKFFFFNVYTTLLLEPGSRYVERRRNPDPFALKL